MGLDRFVVLDIGGVFYYECGFEVVQFDQSVVVG